MTYSLQPPLQLQPGDLLLWLTDGLVEARNAAGEEFGEARVVELLKKHAQLSSRQLLAELRRAVLAHAGGDRLEDDVTLLLVRAR